MLQDGNTEDTERLLEVFAKPLETAGRAATGENNHNSLTQLIRLQMFLFFFRMQIEKHNYRFAEQQFL